MALEEAIEMYLIMHIIILAINIVGYTKIPVLCFLGLITDVIIAWPTIENFGDYWLIGLMLIIINAMLPIIGLTRAFRVVQF